MSELMKANLRITFPNMSDDDFTIFCGVLEEKEKLEQENQQLKEELEDMTLCRDIASGHRKQLQDEELKMRRLKEKYKSVLDEIREYINRFDFEYLHQCYEHNLVEVLEKLLQILDKAGKE